MDETGTEAGERQPRDDNGWRGGGEVGGLGILAYRYTPLQTV